MGQFLLDAIVKPGGAILFCLLFGVPFAFIGFQTVELTGQRTGRTVNMTVRRQHVWGLFVFEREVAGVERVTSTSGTAGTGIRRTRVSGVVLEAGDQRVPLFIGASNVDGALKQGLVADVTAFLQKRREQEFHGTYRMRNLFGWVGLPFAALGVLGLLGWPFGIWRRWREYRGRRREGGAASAGAR